MKRDKYKTYKGFPCKTEQEKKQAEAAAHKKWRTAKKTEAAKKYATKKK